MKIYLTILITILLRQSLPGQGGFKRQFKLPGSLNNTSKNVFETSPGNYIMCGLCVDTLNGFLTNRLVLTGLNSIGQPQWTKKYGNSKFQYLDNSFITKWFFKQGNFIYQTCCVRDSNNKQVGVLIKFDFNGDTLWQKIYTDPTDDVIPQMTTGSVDGGFLITGFFQNNINNTSPVLLIKTDYNGNELWRKKINKTGNNGHDGKVILQDTLTKKIITAGYQYIGTQNKDNVIICDSLGNKLTEISYTGSYGGVLLDLIQTKDKNIVAVGEAIYPQTLGGTNLTKSFIVKFNINSPSVPMWTIDDVGPLALTNFFTRIIELKNEDILVTGILDTMQQNSMPTNCLQRITRYNKLGILVSTRYYDYSLNHAADNNEVILSLNPTSDNGFISAFEVYNTSPSPFFVVKYDSTGCDSTWSYCQSVGFDEHVLKKGIIEVYPNPGSGVINFKGLEGLLNTYGTLTNVLGQKVMSFKNATQLDISELKAGVYFLQVYQSGRLITTEKIIKE
ncbi:MAG: hypothetical protein JWO32_2545 [Bacteroidetes bacterium]|nr:hypothetical protein [Bacteroidota bacterium]